MKISIRAARNKQRGRMRPAGRQFDMPAIEVVRETGVSHKSLNYKLFN